MRLGILADIHEQTKQLREAISVLQQHGAERFVVLGDVFEMGKRIEETVYLLQQVKAVESFFRRIAFRYSAMALR